MMCDCEVLMLNIIKDCFGNTIDCYLSCKKHCLVIRNEQTEAEIVR